MKNDRVLVRLQEELADVGATVEDLNQRAEEVLEALARILPFDAGWLAVRDPERRRHVPLATTGAAEPLHRYFESPGADAVLEDLGLNSAQRPVLASPSPRYARGASTCSRPGSAAARPPHCSPLPAGTWASSASSPTTGRA